MIIERSLLSRIHSKYILKNILSLAYSDMKSIFKLIKYNKSLMDKLDINKKKIKEHFNYNLKIEIKKRAKIFFAFYLVKDIITFIIFMIYFILYYAKGKFNEKTLAQHYDEKKKKYIDNMDKYILPIFLGTIFLAILFNILLCLSRLFAIKAECKAIFIIFPLFDLAHNVLCWIKLSYSEEVTKELNERSNLSYEEDSNLFWFESFDIFICLLPFIYIIGLCCSACCICDDNSFSDFSFKDDEKIIIMDKLNGINIIDYTLPSYFANLSKKAKIEEIFKEDNMKQYQYELKDNQISLITKINDIRRKYNLNTFPIPIINRIERLPDLIIHLKAELFFYPEVNIHKISPNSFIFKYPKNEFQNYLNDDKILNIITIDSLNKINIIEQNNLEFISIYKEDVPNNNDNNRSNRSNNRNNINIKSFRIELPNIEIANTEERLKDNFENLNVTNISETKK